MSATDKIPDDVMKAAKGAIPSSLLHILVGEAYAITVTNIARAIMAEREQCAKLAKTRWMTTDFGSVADADTLSFLCEDIAEAIRKGGVA